ncbi:hypothetical protein KRMM14A1259_49130 [Krasilnikovia sp. MM14-A1259]
MPLDEKEIDDLRRRLGELSDRSAVTDLVARLGVWLDGHGLDDPGTVFTADVTAVTPGGVQQGIDAVAAGARGQHSGYARLQHFTSNVLVDLDGDEASVRANLVAVFISGGDRPATRVLVGHYRFGTRRTPQGWRIARLEVLPSWGAPVDSAALIPSPAA